MYKHNEALVIGSTKPVKRYLQHVLGYIFISKFKAAAAALKIFTRCLDQSCALLVERFSKAAQ